MLTINTAVEQMQSIKIHRRHHVLLCHKGLTAYEQDLNPESWKNAFFSYSSIKLSQTATWAAVSCSHLPCCPV